MIITRSPFRITLGGGGTDLPSFYEKHGGIVFSMALDKYIYMNLKPSVIDTAIRLQYLTPEIVDDINNLKHSRAREALRMHNVLHSIELNSIADLPASSGLGSSGSYLVSLLHALRYYKGKDISPAIVAEEACDIEINILKEPVGKQDQYIAAYGGLKVIDIDKSGNAVVSNVETSFSDIMEFINNTHIYYTGRLRSASEILKEQNNLSQNVEDKLLKIKDLSYQFIESFRSGEYHKFGLLLDEHWELKKKMSNKITIPVVEKIYDRAKRDYGVLGGKIIGAGGGGFLMLYAGKNNKKLEEYMKENNMPRMQYSIDPHGCQVVGDFRSSSAVLEDASKFKNYNLWLDK